MYRIGRRRRNQDASLGGVAVGILPLCHWGSNPWPLSGQGTVSGGQFDWGGRLQKSNGAFKGSLGLNGNQARECKRRSEPDCETDGSSRNESWS